MAEDKSVQRNPPGPIGHHVIANIEQLRQVRGLSYEALSRELGKIGWPINQVSLARMGRGERRAAADDVIAIALVLGVNPSALLLPRNVDRGDPVELTPAISRQAWIAWEWMDGRVPMPGEDTKGDRLAVEQGSLLDHAANSRPAFRRHDAPAVQAAEALYTRILMMLEGIGSAEAVRIQLERVKLEVGGLLGGSPPAAMLSGHGSLGGAAGPASGKD